eukprot:423464-Pyramimonas_sp.AAC.2
MPSLPTCGAEPCHRGRGSRGRGGRREGRQVRQGDARLFRGLHGCARGGDVPSEHRRGGDAPVEPAEASPH